MSDNEFAIGQKLGAEVLGTFVLVFGGVGAAIVSGGDYAATGLAFGLAVLVMAYAVGHISGGHFNPAVSVGAAVGGRISWNHTGMYVLAQLGGALLAGLALFAILQGFPDFDAEGNMGQNAFGDETRRDFAAWAAFLVEALATALFLYVILAVTDRRNPNAAAAPAAIGLMLALIHFATMGMTGTSVNPARSIGVGVFAGSDAVVQLWLFILAPLLGAAIAGITYPLIFGRDADPVPGSGLNVGGSKPDASAQQQLAQQQWGGQPAAQQQSAAPHETQYPGWKWDATAQQWVPDPTTAPQGSAEPDDASRTQIRPNPDETT